jgi:hypothetical protein
MRLKRLAAASVAGVLLLLAAAWEASAQDVQAASKRRSSGANSYQQIKAT